MRLLYAGLMWLLLAVPCAARIISVDDDAPADFNNIQAAIDDANDGDTVIVADGIYRGAGNRDIDFKGKGITVGSTDPNDPDVVVATLIDCNGTEAEPHRGFNFHSGEDANSMLDGLTIANAYAERGSGICCTRSSPSITNCILRSNSARHDGAGMWIDQGSPKIANCTFSGNSGDGVSYSAAGLIPSHCTFSYCTFSDNSGKGVSCSFGKLTMSCCVIRDNYAGGVMCIWSTVQINDTIITRNRGGGMDAGTCALTLRNCTFSYNSDIGGLAQQGHGGGLACSDGYASSAIVLAGCTFSGNSADDMGGGIYSDHALLSLVNCTFSGNSSDEDGGGMYSSNSSVTLVNCTFTKNWAPRGGGVYNRAQSNAVLISCRFGGNDSFSSGGGMYNDDSSPELTGCTFEGNGAGRHGGGMYNINSSPTLRNCTFSSNTVFHPSGGKGGAMANKTSNPAIINSTFSANHATGSGFPFDAIADGGAIYNEESKPAFRGCVFSGNSAKADGGALFNYGGNLVSLANCTFVGNSASEGNAIACDSPEQGQSSTMELADSILADGGSEIFNADGSTIAVGYSNIEGGWPGQGNMDADPLFVDPNNGDYHLKSQAGRWDPASESWVQDDATSPCIDGGDPMSPIGREPFPNGGIINMGAYGGTAEASKSYFDEPVCETIVAGDINGDCKIDWADFRLLALHWLEDKNQ